MVDFEWDPNKADANLHKHGVAFDEATTVFLHPFAITSFDPDHSDDEDRFITVGPSLNGRLLLVAHADRCDNIRIISARQLTRSERRDYEKEIQNRQG